MEGGRERDPLGSASLQNSNTQSLCNQGDVPFKLKDILKQRGKFHMVGNLNTHHYCPETSNLLATFPTQIYSNKHGSKCTDLYSLFGTEAQKFLELLSMHFLFQAKFHSSTIFSICLYSIPVKSCDSESGNEPWQKMVDKLLPGKVWGSEMSPLIPVEKQQWDNQDYSQTPGIHLLIQT